MKIAKVLKGSRLGPWVVAVLCALLLTYTSPRKAEATAVEYAVMLALIIVVCITAIESPAWTPVGDHLKAAAKAARDANSAVNQPKEIAGLSKTIGLAKAMMGITSSCDDCATVREELQTIIGTASALKTEALNVVGACKPNGIIQGNEQCDPLVMPNGGCPITTEGTFCTDQCLCEPLIIP